MTRDSAEIRNQLKQDVLFPFASRFRIYAFLAIISWPLNYALSFMVLKHAFRFDVANSALWAVVGMTVLAGFDTLIYSMIIRNIVREGCRLFTQTFTPYSSEYHMALDILSTIDTPAIRILKAALIRQEESTDGLGLEISPAAKVSLVHEKKVKKGKDDLIDLNESQR